MLRMIRQIKTHASDNNRFLFLSFIVSLSLHAILFIPFPVEKHRQVLLPAKKGTKIEINYTLTTMRTYTPMISEDRRGLRKKVEKTEFLKQKAMKHRKASTSKLKVDSVRENYLHALLRRIHKHKYYPLAAKKMQFVGKVTLQFTLTKHGDLIGKVNLLDPSSYQILNEAAIRTVRQAGPFPEFPPDIGQEERTFMVTLDYALQE
jgi:TonB family protein